MPKRKTKEEYIEDLCQIHNITKDDFSIESYEGWNKPVTFTCKRCGTVKIVSADSLKRKRTHICRCYSDSNQTREYRLAFQNWLFEQNKYEILTPYHGYTKPIKLKCKKCNQEQNRILLNLLKSDNCLLCQTKAVAKKTTELFKQEMNDLYGQEYLVIDEYISAETPITFKHSCGEIFKTKPHHLLCKKGGCPNCRTISKGEKEIHSFLSSNNINFVSQYRLPRYKKRPYDFYLPDYNLIIEFQGKQHSQPVDFFGGEEAFFRQKEIDKEKRQLAISEGYDYLEIYHNQIKEITPILVQRLSLGRE